MVLLLVKSLLSQLHVVLGIGPDSFWGRLHLCSCLPWVGDLGGKPRSIMPSLGAVEELHSQVARDPFTCLSPYGTTILTISGFAQQTGWGWVSLVGRQPEETEA